jgi:integrase/recombinase XerD
MDDNGIARDVSNVTTDVLRSYIAWMLNSKRKWEGHKHKTEANMTVGLSPVTVNTRLKGIRTMFRFLKSEGLIEKNPFDNIKSVEEPESDIQIMSVEQLKKLLSAPNQKSYAGFRDFVMMNILIDGFMRIGEVITLKKSDIDFDTGTLTLSGKITKSRRSRIVPLQRRTLTLIKELINDSEEFESDYVFLTNYGEPITDDQFRNRLKMHAAAARINIRIYPHLFRHTSATMFLENGGDIRHLQLILGHADLRMCIRYTHLSKS